VHGIRRQTRLALSLRKWKATGKKSWLKFAEGGRNAIRRRSCLDFLT
jgi:hypothetical protein